MTNVLIVDDERNIRKAFAADVASAPDRYTLVDAIPGAESALPLCASGKVDLVIMDINTANYENGIEVSARIKQRWPGIRIIVTTSYSDMRTLEQARVAGVDSFWFKDYSEIELLEVMDLTVAGSSWYPQEKPPVPIGETVLSALTKRQYCGHCGGTPHFRRDRQGSCPEPLSVDRLPFQGVAAGTCPADKAGNTQTVSPSSR